MEGDTQKTALTIEGVTSCAGRKGGPICFCYAHGIRSAVGSYPAQSAIALKFTCCRLAVYLRTWQLIFRGVVFVGRENACNIMHGQNRISQLDANVRSQYDYLRITAQFTPLPISESQFVSLLSPCANEIQATQ